MIDKDFFLSVLGASATKRDAKGYLSRFEQPKSTKGNKAAQSEQVAPYARGVNLGGLYSSPRAVVQAPVFTQDSKNERRIRSDSKIHVAIVELKQPQTFSDDEIDGVALTLGQLARLGLPSTVVLDFGGAGWEGATDYQQWRDRTIFETRRLVAAIQRTGKSTAQVLDQALSYSSTPHVASSTVGLDAQVNINYSTMLLTALRNGVVPVIPPIAYDKQQQAVRVSADEVVLAITRQFAGLNTEDQSNTAAKQGERQVPDSTQSNISVDRIIILDPAGGLPATDRRDKAHVFVNLEQEYHGIRQQLGQMPDIDHSHAPPTANAHSVLGGSNPFSAFVEDEMHVQQTNETKKRQLSPTAEQEISESHVQNLDLLQRTLTLLPPAASGLIIRPQEVASAALTSRQQYGVGTRQQRNPLIHNLLTDKPIISPSLPLGRVSPSRASTNSSATNDVSELPSPHATFVKRGMPVTIIPDPKLSLWSPPGPEGTKLTLEDPRIDFPRLLHLIEDSFGRKLDVKHYLNRIQKQLAGIIVAGEYEGGAILTWEHPPSTDGTRRPPVPYLDKFAVLKRSQGAGGVADVVFNAMVRTCFPGGVVWRSRKNNPVNRWYFERADGTWKIPDTQWTMFWTGDELWGGGEKPITAADEWRRDRWKDYVGVCKSIGASWADDKAPD